MLSPNNINRRGLIYVGNGCCFQVIDVDVHFAVLPSESYIFEYQRYICPIKTSGTNNQRFHRYNNVTNIVFKHVTNPGMKYTHFERLK